MYPRGEMGGGNPEDFKMPKSPEDNEKKEEKPPSVPENEMHFYYARSGGPGGQAVNKKNSKAGVRWNVGKSLPFSDKQKDLIREYGATYLTNDDDLVMDYEQNRSQHQNKSAVIENLQTLVKSALEPKVERIETKVSRNQKEKRLDSKGKNSDKKKERKWRPED